MPFGLQTALKPETRENEDAAKVRMSAEETMNQIAEIRIRVYAYMYQLSIFYKERSTLST